MRTAELSGAELSELRSFLDDAFGERFTQRDWEHSLGGVHVLLRDDGKLVGHASVVKRLLEHGGLTLHTGYVEAVAVRADRRGAGLGSAAMAVVEADIGSTYELGALSAGGRAARLYERRGWRRWEGSTWVVSPSGLRRTEDEDGGVFVLMTPATPEINVAGDIACDWREGDVW